RQERSHAVRRQSKHSALVRDDPCYVGPKPPKTFFEIRPSLTCLREQHRLSLDAPLSELLYDAERFGAIGYEADSHPALLNRPARRVSHRGHADAAPRTRIEAEVAEPCKSVPDGVDAAEDDPIEGVQPAQGGVERPPILR